MIVLASLILHIDLVHVSEWLDDVLHLKQVPIVVVVRVVLQVALILLVLKGDVRLNLPQLVIIELHYLLLCLVELRDLLLVQLLQGELLLLLLDLQVLKDEGLLLLLDQLLSGLVDEGLLLGIRCRFSLIFFRHKGITSLFVLRILKDLIVGVIDVFVPFGGGSLDLCD